MMTISGKARETSLIWSKYRKPTQFLSMKAKCNSYKKKDSTVYRIKNLKFIQISKFMK